MAEAFDSMQRLKVGLDIGIRDEYVPGLEPSEQSSRYYLLLNLQLGAARGMGWVARTSETVPAAADDQDAGVKAEPATQEV